jgi:hypothetical protein
VPVTGHGSAQLSTIAVENSVDDLRECRPSAESAEEFYEMATKSPLQNITNKFNKLRTNAATFLSPGQGSVALVIRSA